jgi:hypothetical protein
VALNQLDTHVVRFFTDGKLQEESFRPSTVGRKTLPMMVTWGGLVKAVMLKEVTG